MKKFFLLCSLTVSSFATTFAADDMFDHLSVGITTGTPGLIGVDAAMPCTPYLQLRAGVAFMPNFKYEKDIKLTEAGVTEYNKRREDINAQLKKLHDRGELSEYTPVTEEVKSVYGVEGKAGFVNGKVIVDFFPFKNEGFPFFVSAGAYIGTSEIITIRNTESLNIINQANDAIRNYNNNADKISGYSHVNELSADLGGYRDYENGQFKGEGLRPDQGGDMEFDIKVNGFKPYLGLGFGRIIPNESRIGFCVELGCMFWNTPKVEFVGGNANGDVSFEIDKDKAGKEDIGEAIDVVSKFSVFPVLNFRLCYKIF